MPIIIILLVLIIILLVTNIRVVPQATEFGIERLGTYYTTWETGLHFKVPLVDRGQAHLAEGTGDGLCTPTGYHQG